MPYRVFSRTPALLTRCQQHHPSWGDIAKCLLGQSGPGRAAGVRTAEADHWRSTHFLRPWV